MGKRPSGEGGDGRMDGRTDGKATQPAPRRAPAPCLHPFRGPSSSLPPLPAAFRLLPRTRQAPSCLWDLALATACAQNAVPSWEHSASRPTPRSIRPSLCSLGHRPREASPDGQPHVKQHRPQPSRLLAQPQFILWHLLLPGITIRVYASGFYYMSLLLGCKFNQSFFYSPLNP